MASTFAAKEQPRPSHHQVSPQNSFKKAAWPANPHQPPTPSCAALGHPHPHHQAGGALPKCVCAPATHAGSFKCRLHRVNSHGHSTPTTPPSTGPASSTRTIEAL